VNRTFLAELKDYSGFRDFVDDELIVKESI
jgi:hypothetical protein